VAAAEQAAATLQAESQKKLREEVARLEATRTELATDVESMARHLESERGRLRGALSDLLKWVDENVQPANSLMGVRPKSAPVDAPSSGGGGGDATSEEETGDPTLNLQSAASGAGTGASHSL
jgi:hypothetical protein